MVPSWIRKEAKRNAILTDLELDNPNREASQVMGTQNTRMYATFGVPSDKNIALTHKPAIKDFPNRKQNENKRSKKKKEKDNNERRGSNKGNVNSNFNKNPKKKQSTQLFNSDNDNSFQNIKATNDNLKEDEFNLDEEEKKISFRPILKKKITVPSHSDLDSQLSLSAKSKSFIIKDKEMSDESEIKKRLSFFLDENQLENKRK